jgi:HKD family nuclease
MKDIFLETIDEIKQGMQTGYIDSSINSNLAFRPELIFNDYKKGKKVLSTIEEELQQRFPSKIRCRRK